MCEIASFSFKAESLCLWIVLTKHFVGTFKQQAGLSLSSVQTVAQWAEHD